jgi:uncharacterized protein (DUF488 family)
VIYTIGHSNRSIETFLALLAAHDIERVADIRRFPRSARYPHFDETALAASLKGAGITYLHFPDLGGRRNPRRDSPNAAWRVPAFRGYADYMGTAQFSGAVSELLQFAGGGRTTVMCAEAVWWQCHRRLLADALVVGGVPVAHIASAAAPKMHQMSEFARELNGRVVYPGLL